MYLVGKGIVTLKEYLFYFIQRQTNVEGPQGPVHYKCFSPNFNEFQFCLIFRKISIVYLQQLIFLQGLKIGKNALGGALSNLLIFRKIPITSDSRTHFRIVWSLFIFFQAKMVLEQRLSSLYINDYYKYYNYSPIKRTVQLFSCGNDVTKMYIFAVQYK